jgi:phosphoglycerol transferase MdoB-like AlkP superfamily enzyme
MGNKYILIGKEKLYLFENHKTSNYTPVKDKERKKKFILYIQNQSSSTFLFFKCVCKFDEVAYCISLNSICIMN